MSIIDIVSVAGPYQFGFELLYRIRISNSGPDSDLDPTIRFDRKLYSKSLRKKVTSIGA